MMALSAKGIRKAFESVVALDGVTLEIQQGEFYGLLGPNGAGKTTMLRILSSLLAPDAGTVTILGEAVVRWKPSPALGVVPQEIALYDRLTARQNLDLFGSLNGLKGAALSERIEAVLKAVGLETRQKSRVSTFSTGMKRRLNLAIGLLHDPEILLLDEPTVGVDPQSRARIFALLGDLHKAGKTLIYTTHYMEEAERLCQRIGIIDHGKLIAEGTLSELLARIELPRSLRVHSAVPVEKCPEIPQVECICGESHFDFTPRGAQSLGALVTAVENSGIPYDRMELIGPNLETLFLQLTGRELRD
ncbi:MAG: ABC transporter ATP-binding protein [bacterium]